MIRLRPPVLHVGSPDQSPAVVWWSGRPCHVHVCLCMGIPISGDLMRSLISPPEDRLSMLMSVCQSEVHGEKPHQPVRLRMEL